MSIRFSDFGRKLNNDSKRNANIRLSESIRTSSSREALFSGEFQIGSIVETEGKLQEVLDIRSNYLVLIDESGNTKKKFAHDVKLIPEGTIEYPGGTFKGVKIGNQEIRSLVEDYLEKKFSDAFAVVKCAKLFNENKEVEYTKAMSSIGYIVENKTEQLAILRIIGDVIDIKSIEDAGQLTSAIEKKFKTIKMNSQQKKIFMDMISLAKKQGVKIDISESEEDAQKEKKDLNKDDDTDERIVAHTTPGHSLRFSNNTHRHQLVRRLKGLD